MPIEGNAARLVVEALRTPHARTKDFSDGAFTCEIGIDEPEFGLWLVWESTSAGHWAEFFLARHSAEDSFSDLVANRAQIVRENQEGTMT